MIAPHHLLNRVAALVESGVLRTTLGEHDGRITVDNPRRAHAALESHRTAPAAKWCWRDSERAVVLMAVAAAGCGATARLAFARDAGRAPGRRCGDKAWIASDGTRCVDGGIGLCVVS
ncbi:hypothetical protein GGR76_003232 [Xanthomonas translucens]|uniref:hypothetical protein n=1 Tax=Xanthomonas campestris TaxID=339 RepID=UPI0023E9A069|nr:hypothetical protein [Xanthomonas campestris]